MKKVLIIVLAIIIPSTLNAHPLGLFDKKVDYNFKCEMEFSSMFGFKLYEFKKDGSKILVHLSFSKKHKDYGFPDSEVKYLGSMTLGGIEYDHAQIWYNHLSKPNEKGKYQLFRYILLHKGNDYVLFGTLYESNKELTKKLNKIFDLVENYIDTDHDKVANYLSSYYNQIKKYLETNRKEKFIFSKKHKCISLD